MDVPVQQMRQSRSRCGCYFGSVNRGACLGGRYPERKQGSSRNEAKGHSECSVHELGGEANCYQKNEGFSGQRKHLRPVSIHSRRYSDGTGRACGGRTQSADKDEARARAARRRNGCGQHAATPPSDGRALCPRRRLAVTPNGSVPILVYHPSRRHGRETSAFSWSPPPERSARHRVCIVKLVRCWSLPRLWRIELREPCEQQQRERSPSIGTDENSETVGRRYGHNTATGVFGLAPAAGLG